MKSSKCNPEQSANQKRQGHSDAKLATVFVPEPDIEPGRCTDEQWNGHERIDQCQKRQRLLDNKTQMHIPPARTRDSITIWHIPKGNVVQSGHAVDQYLIEINIFRVWKTPKKKDTRTGKIQASSFL